MDQFVAIMESYLHHWSNSHKHLDRVREGNRKKRTTAKLGNKFQNECSKTLHVNNFCEYKWIKYSN